MDQNVTPELNSEPLSERQQLDRLDRRLQSLQNRMLLFFVVGMAWVGLQPQVHLLLRRLQAALLEKSFEERASEFCDVAFGPFLRPVFAPVNTFLSSFFQPIATICAIGMFVGTMIWVGALLNSRYVNRGNPHKSLLADLRIWTVLSMLPHVLVYVYFR